MNREVTPSGLHRLDHIVVTIISIRLTGPTWQGHFYQIVVGIVIIFGFVLLQVYHADEIAVGVVVIAMSKLLFEQLHIVEIDGVQRLDIGRVDAHLGVGLGCLDHAGNKLPISTGYDSRGPSIVRQSVYSVLW